jgi:hypothetical protein
MYKYSSAFPLGFTVNASDKVGHGLIGTTSLHLEISSIPATAFLACKEALSNSRLLELFQTPICSGSF